MRRKEKHCHKSDYTPDNNDGYNDQCEKSPEIPFKEITFHRFAHGSRHTAMRAGRRLIADLLAALGTI